MPVDTIVVLVLVGGFFGVIVWAEIYSRRHHKPESSEAPDREVRREEPALARKGRKLSA